MLMIVPCKFLVSHCWLLAAERKQLAVCFCLMPFVPDWQQLMLGQGMFIRPPQ